MSFRTLGASPPRSQGHRTRTAAGSSDAGRSHVGIADFTAGELDRTITNGLRYALDGPEYHNDY